MKRLALQFIIWLMVNLVGVFLLMTITLPLMFQHPGEAIPLKLEFNAFYYLIIYSLFFSFPSLVIYVLLFFWDNLSIHRLLIKSLWSISLLIGASFFIMSFLALSLRGGLLFFWPFMLTYTVATILVVALCWIWFFGINNSKYSKEDVSN